MVNIPKELNPKSKISIFEIKSLGYLIVFLGTIFGLIMLLNITQGIVFKLIIFSTSVGIMFLFSSKKYGNTFLLLKNSFFYQINKKNKSNYLVDNTKKKKTKVNVNGKIKYKNKVVMKKNSELEEDLLKQYNINDIDFKDNIITTDSKKITFLEVKIKNLPYYLSLDEQENTIKDFHDLLKVEAKGSLFSINEQYDFTKEINDLDQRKIDNKLYKDFLDLKKWQFKNAEKFFKIKYFLEVGGDDLKQLETNIMKYRGMSFEVGKVNDYDFKKIIDDRYLKQIKNEVYEDYQYNPISKKYISYLNLTEFESLQKPYFLDALFNTNYDININFKEVKNFKKTFDSATAEILSRKKYDKRRTTKIEINNSLNFIDTLNKEIINGNQRLLRFEMIIRIDENSLEKLKAKKELIQSKYKNNGYLSYGYYNQKKHSFNYNKLVFEHSVKSGYTVSSKSLSYGYPFDFVEFAQAGGQIKNINKNTLLKLNFYSSETKNEHQDGSGSYDKIFIGVKGSGKSSALKEDALEELILKNANVLLIDFDKETQKLIDKFEGEYLRIGQININPLRIIYNFSNTNNLSDHFNFILIFLNKIYLLNEQEKIIIKEELKDLYDKWDINEDTIYKQKKYPTFEQFYEYLKESIIIKEKSDDKDFQQVVGKIKDFVFSYPYFSKFDEKFKVDNSLTSFGFDQIKDDEKILNASLMIVMRYINFRMRFNKVDDTSFIGDENKLKEYINEYVCVNKLKVSEEFNNLNLKQKLIYINKNKRFFRIIIDEAHRLFKNDEAVKMIDPLVRDSRKYYSGLTFADHSIELLLNISSTSSVIFQIIPYKIFLKTDTTQVDILKKEIKLSEHQIKKLVRVGNGQGLIHMNGKTFEYHSPLNPRMIEIFDGGE